MLQRLPIAIAQVKAGNVLWKFTKLSPSSYIFSVEKKINFSKSIW